MDDNNRDGMRPESLFVTVNNNQIVELNEQNNWTGVVEDQPVYANGGRILIYDWREPGIDGYTLTDISTADTVTTLTNVHEPITINHTVAIAWDDANNQDGLRPASVTLTLNANGTPVQTVTLTPGNNWSTAITNLPANENGEAIVYTWTEAAVPGYTRTGTNTVGTPNGVAASTVTYRHVPETINLTVRKEWIDDDPSKRPDYLNVVLTGTNGENEMVTLNPANEWTGTVTGLARYNAGREVQYTWTEPSVPGYTHTSTATADAMTVFTNTQVVVETPPTEYTLTVYYRFADGSTAAPAYTGTFREGDAYDAPSPAIDGYYVTIPRVTGTMPGRNTVFTVIYMPVDESIIIEELDTPLGLGDSQMFLNIDDCLD